MHVLVKPVVAALAAVPLAGAAFGQHVKAVFVANGAAAACEARVFAAPEPTGRKLLAMIALADASATYGEQADASLFCPTR